MVPSRTVENYLKAIYQAQIALDQPQAQAQAQAEPGPGGLVPMGHLATALGVVPGTATTMVKTLADSGLVTYEPYAGVRLTGAGEKLAAMVLRRHRLIELFLVRMMGMSWAEVHEEAEQLEHAVSDRLIERIDQMLDHPSVDPHGDPIPGPGDVLRQRQSLNLLTCPLRTPVIVTRVTDQDAEFLRFIENSDLKPGREIEIEDRDPASDSVRLRPKESDRPVTIGMRAASKLLVEVVQAVILVLALAAAGSAQTPSPPSDRNRPFEILDNSFLVEEAFNQEAGIFQNIFGVLRSSADEWEFAVTQEWPLGGQRHQFSYVLPFASTLAPSLAGAQRGLSDVLLNYRFQALEEGPGRPAFAPRFSLILPTGAEEDGLGAGTTGFQVNLPFSKQRGDVYFHWNAGVTMLPGVYSGQSALTREAEEVGLLTPHVSGSAIWRVRPMLNLMLEAIAEFEEGIEDVGTTSRTTVFTLSPGLRGGWNLGDHQLIVGFAVPVSFADDDEDVGVFGYFSYELPFKR